MCQYWLCANIDCPCATIDCLCANIDFCGDIDCLCADIDFCVPILIVYVPLLIACQYWLYVCQYWLSVAILIVYVPLLIVCQYWLSVCHYWFLCANIDFCGDIDCLCANIDFCGDIDCLCGNIDCLCTNIDCRSCRHWKVLQNVIGSRTWPRSTGRYLLLNILIAALTWLIAQWISNWGWPWPAACTGVAGTLLMPRKLLSSVVLFPDYSGQSWNRRQLVHGLSQGRVTEVFGIRLPVSALQGHFELLGANCEKRLSFLLSVCSNGRLGRQS